MEIWDGDHLSELALSCLADAQDVVDPVARVHAESCATCMMRIGKMALESHDVGAALRVAREMSAKSEAQTVKPAHRFPTLLVGVAAAVAVVCGAPAMLDGVPRIVTWVFAAPHVVPVLTTSVMALVKSFSSGPSGAAISLVSTFALAVFGYAIARASSRHGASQ